MNEIREDETNENLLIQLGLSKLLVDLCHQRYEMKEKAYNKKTDKYCFTEDELFELVKTNNDIKKIKYLIHKFAETE